MGPSAGWVDLVRVPRACLGVLRLDWRPQEGCGGFFLLPDVKTIKVYQKLISVRDVGNQITREVFNKFGTTQTEFLNICDSSIASSGITL